MSAGGADPERASRRRALRAWELGLVRRVLEGDETAIRELVEYLTPVVQSRVARVLVRHGESLRQHTADYTQDVLVNIFRGNLLRSWDAAAGCSLKNYVGASAHYYVVAELRTLARRPFAAELNPDTVAETLSVESSPEARAASRELLQRLLERLFASLSPQRFDLLLRLFVHHESPEQIREETDMSPSALDQCRSRLRREARAILASIDPRLDDVELTQLIALVMP